MKNKIIKLCRHLLYIICTNFIYGVILYNVCTWLAGFSLMHAFLGNLALILMGLALDEQNYKMFQSDYLYLQIAQIEKEKDRERNYRIIQWMMDSFVSFKTVLYVFYVFILIVSQVIDFNPALVGEDLGNFIIANRYSILLLIAFDMIIGQFSKDKERMEEIAAKFRERYTGKD